MAGSQEDSHALPDQGGASFGSTGYGDPYHRLPPPGQCRIRINPAQLAFHWTGCAAPIEPATPDTPTTAPPATRAVPISEVSGTVSTPAPALPPSAISVPSRKLGAASPALLKVKRPFKEVVERFLRENGVPYIAVDEAKKALFAGAKLRSFHFVVYRTPQKNWLLHTAQMRKEVRECLREWEAVFGDGFMAVVAKQKSDGKLRFMSLAGEALQIDSAAGHSA